jgi:hypothetical protein
MGAKRQLSRTLVLCCAVLLVAAAAQATPLGLQPGDVIDTIEWDALDTNGEGGNYLVTTEELLTNGRITDVQVERAPAFPPTLTSIPQSNVSLFFAVQLDNAAVLPPAPGNLLTTWVGSALTDPDVVIQENGVNILTGDFDGDFYFGGFLNQTTLIATGNIVVTDGHPDLVAALGSSGMLQLNKAVLELTTSVFGFDPSLNELMADNIAGNENFFVEFSGTLRAVTPSPFVPEPGTMALLGLGLLGLLAVGRRRSR